MSNTLLNKAVAFILLSCSISLGAVLPPETKIEVYDDFTGGLNTDLPSSKLPKNQSPNMRNVIIDDGDIHKIGGYYTVGSTPTLSKINLLYVYVKDDGSKEYIVSDSSIVLATKDFNVYTLLRKGLNSNFKINCFNARGKVWMTNGIDAPFTYDASTIVILDGGLYGGNVVANAPRCKYGAYWQDRVWLYNANTDASIVRWSALTSTDDVPVAIAPDSENAWKNDEFARYIGRGDGQIGTGMKVYLGRLQLFKERSIYSMQGNDDASYNEVRTIGGYGFTDNDSVVELDGYLYGKGQDAIYQYNGGQMVRITDDIAPDMSLIASNHSNIVSNVWDTQSDFSKGYFSASTATQGGGLTVLSTAYIMGNSFDSSIAGFSMRDATSSVKYSSIAVIISNFYGDYSGRVRILSMGVQVFSNDGSPYEAREASDRIGTLKRYSDLKATVNEILGGSVTWKADISTANSNVSGIITLRNLNSSEISQTTFSINNFIRDGFYVGICSFSTVGYNPSTIILYNTTGSYISDISTISNITYWDALESFDSIPNNNLHYFYRTSTSSVNIATYPWIPINSGLIITSSKTDNYIQWASTMICNSYLEFIDKVTIGHNVGGFFDSNPFGCEWGSRYWCVVSTVTEGDTSLIYIKSKITNPGGQNRWMVVEGMNLKSILRDGNYLYGGASTSGTVYRLETGLNFDGRPIHAWWRTRHATLGAPFFDKTLLEYSVDMERQYGASLTIGTALDGGEFTNYNFNIDGIGRIIKNYPLPLSHKKGNMFQWEFSNNELNKDMSLYNFGVFYVPTAIRTNNQ